MQGDGVPISIVNESIDIKNDNMKIIEKINSQVDNGETFYSFEYFPPKTEDGVKNLHERQKYMQSLNPLFCDITWGAGGSTADLTLTIADKMQKEVRP